MKDYTVDRSGWGSGPWDNEPDYKEWVDQKTGLQCMAIRNPYGIWCGYVGLPVNHDLYGLGGSVFEDFHVHGGVTYASSHPRDPNETDLWWVGFDCAHSNDLCPDPKMAVLRKGVYRTLSFVEDSCARLARQLV